MNKLICFVAVVVNGWFAVQFPVYCAWQPAPFFSYSPPPPPILKKEKKDKTALQDWLVYFAQFMLVCLRVRVTTCMCLRDKFPRILCAYVGEGGGRRESVSVGERKREWERVSERERERWRFFFFFFLTLFTKLFQWTHQVFESDPLSASLQFPSPGTPFSFSCAIEEEPAFLHVNSSLHPKDSPLHFDKVREFSPRLKKSELTASVLKRKDQTQKGL